MAKSRNKAVRVVDRTIVKASVVGPGLDLGDYATLEVSIQRLDAGGATTGYVQLAHASVDEIASYVSLGTPVDVTGSATTVVQTLSHLRYVRWFSSSNVNGTPLMAIEIIAKEH